jgi:adenylylsulfate kinase
MKILICGLPGSGKTTLAKAMQKKLNCAWFNADVVRTQFNDWDFSHEGRLRQSKRMLELANASNDKYVICDFVAPTNQIRTVFGADFTIFMDTIKLSTYDDTNKMFETPTIVDVAISEYGYEIDEVVSSIRQKNEGKEKNDLD